MALYGREGTATFYGPQRSGVEGYDLAVFNAVSLSADGTVTRDLTAPKAERIQGQVQSGNDYTVKVIWYISSSLTTSIRTEQISTGVTGGTWSEFDLDCRSPFLQIEVEDVSSLSSTVNGTVHLR
jgi:hypothetical protein